jgi:hypothetical protein
VWAKPETLVALRLADVEDVIAAASARVKPALEATIASQPTKGKVTARPPPIAPSSPASPVAKSSLANPKKRVAVPKPSSASWTPPPTTQGLSDYELMRLQRIADNEATLDALGIGSAKEALRHAATPEKRQVSAALAAARAHDRQKRLEEAQASKRQSPRISATPEEQRVPKRYAEEFNHWEDEEEEALYRQVHTVLAPPSGQTSLADQPCQPHTPAHRRCLAKLRERCLAKIREMATNSSCVLWAPHLAFAPSCRARNG